jgi:hypothetical protein
MIDATGGKIPVSEYEKNETRFRMVEKIDPEGYRRYQEAAQEAAERRMATYQHISQLRLSKAGEEPQEESLQKVAN